jgi:hypothetical protein
MCRLNHRALRHRRMVRQVRCVVAAAAALTLSSPAALLAAPKENPNIAQLKRLPAELEPLVTVKGDSLDPSITVTTNGVIKEVNKGFLMSTTREDSFLRAFIDKKTGAVVAQIYHVAEYGGRGWNYFNRASYEGPSGLIEVQTDSIGSDVDCQRYGCYYTEEVGIPVDFALLELMATKYDPAIPLMGLKYRLFGKSGETVDSGIPINEIVAFVNVVHRSALRNHG